MFLRPPSAFGPSFLACSRMWCTSCRQDVPGVSVGDGMSSSVRAARCVRCGKALVAQDEYDGAIDAVALQPKVAGSGGLAASPVYLPQYDGWELEQQLEHVRRVLARLRPAGSAEKSPLDRRFDVASPRQARKAADQAISSY